MMDRGLSEKSLIKDVSKLHRFFVFLMGSPKYNLKYNPVSRISKQLPKSSKQT
jgi:site-specific recombinase XerC